MLNLLPVVLFVTSYGTILPSHIPLVAYETWAKVEISAFANTSGYTDLDEEVWLSATTSGNPPFADNWRVGVLGSGNGSVSGSGLSYAQLRNDGSSTINFGTPKPSITMTASGESAFTNSAANSSVSLDSTTASGSASGALDDYSVPATVTWSSLTSLAPGHVTSKSGAWSCFANGG